MKYLIAVATLFSVVATNANAGCTTGVAPAPIFPVPCPVEGGAGSSGVAFAAPVIITTAFFAYKLGQLYNAGEVQHRKLSRCEWTLEACGTPQGNLPARFYNNDNR